MSKFLKDIHEVTMGGVVEITRVVRRVKLDARTYVVYRKSNTSKEHEIHLEPIEVDSIYRVNSNEIDLLAIHPEDRLDPEKVSLNETRAHLKILKLVRIVKPVGFRSADSEPIMLQSGALVVYFLRDFQSHLGVIWPKQLAAKE